MKNIGDKNDRGELSVTLVARYDKNHGHIISQKKKAVIGHGEVMIDEKMLFIISDIKVCQIGSY